MRTAVMIGVVALLCVPVMAGQPGVGRLAKVPSAVLPPGNIPGRLVEFDGITPHGNVLVSLRDAKTGAEIMRTVADRNGAFVLRKVPEGRYIVYVGNPGLGAYLRVTKEAEAGTLTITLPQALNLPKPAALPKWWKDQPRSTKAMVGGGALLLIGGAVYYHVHASDKTTGKVLSPIHR